MRLQETYKTLENDCFNGPRPAPLLIVDPNPLHDLNHFSLILRLENTGVASSNGMRAQRPAFRGRADRRNKAHYAVVSWCAALEETD